MPVLLTTSSMNQFKMKSDIFRQKSNGCINKMPISLTNCNEIFIKLKLCLLYACRQNQIPFHLEGMPPIFDTDWDVFE